MAYNPTTWVDNSAPTVNAENLNNIEQGIVDVDTRLAALEGAASSAMELIYEELLASAQASFDITSIPDSYKHLALIFQARSDDGAGQDTTWCRINNDSGSNYYSETLTVYAETTSPVESLGGTQIFTGNVPAAAAPAGAAGSGRLHLPNYAGTTFQKIIEGLAVNRNGTVSTGVRQDHISGHWLNTAAINRLTLYPGNGEFIAGSQVSLYGLL